MDRSRRDLLKMGALSMVAAAAPARYTQGEVIPRLTTPHDHTGYKPPLSGLRAIGQNYEPKLQAEIDEILKFRDRLAHPPNVIQGISIPHATLPVNAYMRLTQEQLDAAEPQIPIIHTALVGGTAWCIDDVSHALSVRLNAYPDMAELVDRINIRTADGSLMPQDRVISPRFTIDVEEPYFGMRTTAAMLLAIVEGIRDEWQSKFQSAMDSYRTGKQAEGKSDVITRDMIRGQVTPIQIFARKEAFMLDVMGWNVGACIIE